MKKTTAERTAYFGMFIALAFVFSYVESIIPMPHIIPGVKLGFANIVVLTSLYALGVKEALIISIIRIILVGFTFGNMFSIIYSMAGGILSWIAMSLCKKIKKFSMVGVSIIGGVFHNVGQIVVAAIVVGTKSIMYYLPILLVAGVITGLLIGILGGVLLKVQKKILG